MCRTWYSCPLSLWYSVLPGQALHPGPRDSSRPSHFPEASKCHSLVQIRTCILFRMPWAPNLASSFSAPRINPLLGPKTEKLWKLHPLPIPRCRTSPKLSSCHHITRGHAWIGHVEEVILQCDLPGQPLLCVGLLHIQRGYDHVSLAPLFNRNFILSLVNFSPWLSSSL